MSWIHYFAYGSNMLQQRLQTRTPSAFVLATGYLPGHRLDFGKLGRDGSGKCDVPIASANERAWGVIYAIRSDEVRELDRIEGAPDHYARVKVAIQVGGRILDVETYVARRRGTGLRPFHWYHALVLAGAGQQRLPHDYIAVLENHPYVPDPDQERRARRDAEAVLNCLGLHIPTFPPIARHR